MTTIDTNKGPADTLPVAPHSLELAVTPPATLLLDAQQKAKAYAGLARMYASNDNGWMAVHAQAASDLSSAAAVVVSSECMAIGEFHRKAESLLSATVFRDGSPLAVALEVRHSIGVALPRENEKEWTRTLPNLSFLEELMPLSHVQGELLRRQRLGEMDTTRFILSRRNEQTTKLNMANQAWLDNDAWVAVEATYAADLAGYEAWLTERSVLLGDSDLTQCELLWGLGCAAIEKIANLPQDPVQAIRVVRSRLTWTVGPREMSSLISILTDPVFMIRESAA